MYECKAQYRLVQGAMLQLAGRTREVQETRPYMQLPAFVRTWPVGDAGQTWNPNMALTFFRWPVFK